MKNLILIGIFLMIPLALNAQDKWKIVSSKYQLYYRAAACADSLNCVAVGSSPGKERVHLSDDGGQSWRFVLPDSILYDDPDNRLGGRRLYTVSYPDTSLIIVGCDSGFILKSTDRGLSWSKRRLQTAYDINKIHFLNHFTGILQTKQSVYLSQDGGQSWEELFSLLEKIDNSSIWDAEIYGNCKIIVDYFNLKDNQYHFALSSDTGKTWNDIKPPYSLGNVKLCFSDSLNGWQFYNDFDKNSMHHYINNVMKTSDGGYNWEYQINEMFEPYNADLRSMYMFNNKKGFIAGNKGKLFYTINGGKDWIRDQAWFLDDIMPVYNAVVMPSATTALIFTSNGYILRYDENFTSLDDISDPFDKSFVSPQPVKSGESFAIHVFKDSALPVSCQLYDLSGKLIDEFLFDSGKQYFIYNMSERKYLPPGIYFLLLIYPKEKSNIISLVIE